MILCASAARGGCSRQISGLRHQNHDEEEEQEEQQQQQQEEEEHLLACLSSLIPFVENPPRVMYICRRFESEAS
jgi:hypothetical protein